MFFDNGNVQGPLSFLRLPEFFILNSGQQGDDSDAHLDLNGNPVTRENYAQMRQSPGGPKSDGGSILAISPGSTAGPEGMQHNELDKKRMRKQKRLEKNQYTKASSETIQDFKGDKSLDDLLLFLGEKKTVVNSSDGTSGVKLSKKKQKLVNGQAPVPQKDTVDDGPKKEIVTPKGKFSAMGNNAGREGDVSLEIVNPSEINEEKDKGNNEFHDCLNSVPKESLNFNFATNVKVNENLNTKPHSDSSKPLKIDINTKKSQRNKTNKREKSEVSKSHGIQSNTVNHEQNDFHLDFPMDFSDDFQPFKREETFTEVKKKKKKTPVKENNLPNHYSTNNVQPYVSSSFYQPRANGSSYRPSQRPRASSPPPVQDGSYDEPSLPSTEHSSPRDLSPSAFPVLSGHSPSGLRVEGRRNSCGDINPENLDNKVLYDSDRESVQSLPGANGTEQSSDNYSVYPVSYARIAAASKRGYESTNSPSSESGVVSGSHNSSVSSSIFHTPGSSAEASSPLSPTDTVVSTPDRKTTVWKGSPRERRHSIGSSPEDMVEADMTGITHRSRQKSGSTEFLVRDGSPVPTQDGIIRSASPPVKNILTISNNDSIDEICLSKDGSHTDLIKPQSYESIMISDKQGSVSSVSAHLIENKDSVVQTDNKDLSSHTNIVTVDNDNNMSSCAESIDRKSVSNNVSTKSSVVFLDKRFDTKPKKTLGITFGFGDDDVDNTSSLENTSSQDKLGSNKQQKTVASTTKHSHQSSLQVSSHLSSAKYSKPPTHIPSSSSNQLSTSISQSTSSHQSSQINHSDNSKQSINKETCNGVIVPSDVVSQQKMHTTAAQSSTNSSISGAVRTPTHRPPQPVPALPAVPRLPMIGGVVFSPNHPPPPLPVHHASQFQPIPAHIVPPALPKENNSNQIHTDSNTDFPTLKSATTKSPKDKGLGGPVGQSPIPSPSKSSSATERVNAAAASASSPDSPLRVVYGLKIKPEGGCGVLLFRPPIYKESRRGKSSEASGFLKKKWNHITDPTNKKNSQVFITVSDT